MGFHPKTRIIFIGFVGNSIFIKWFGIRVVIRGLVRLNRESSTHGLGVNPSHGARLLVSFESCLWLMILARVGFIWFDSLESRLDAVLWLLLPRPSWSIWHLECSSEPFIVTLDAWFEPSWLVVFTTTRSSHVDLGVAW